MKTTFLFLLIISYSFFTSCDKASVEPKTELDKLPPITQTGENTFGCLVNGEALFNRNSYQMHAIYQGGFVQFGSGMEDKNIERNINFLLMDPLETDINYDLKNLPMHRAMFKSSLNENTCWYEYEDTFEGTLIFSKIDRTNFIISGTFEFSTVNENCDTIEITDGRFDMQYIP